MDTSRKEQIDFIKLIEKKFTVEDLNYKGVNWWPAIRARLGLGLWFKTDIKRPNNSYLLYNLGLLKKVLEYFFNYFFNFILKQKIKKINSTKAYNTNYDVLIFSFPNQTTEKINEKYLNQYIEPIINGIQNSFSVLTIQFINRQSKDKTYYFHNYLVLLDEQLGSFYFFFKVLFKSFFKKDILPNVFQDFFDMIKAKQKRKIIDIWSIFLLIQNTLHSKKKTIALLKEKQPKIVLITGYYTAVNYGIILACKEVGIPVVDCQHGVQGDLHSAYTKWNKTPEKGYMLLPSWYFVYRENDRQFLENTFNNSLSHNVKVIGNQWAKICNDNFTNRCISKEKLNILYTPDIQCTKEYMYEFMLKTQHKYNWLIRFHPREIQKQKDSIALYEKIGFVTYKYKEPSKLNLFYLLSQVDVHISDISSVVIDSLFVGLKSILVGEEGYELYKENINREEIVFCSNYSELYDKVKENKFKFKENSDVIDLKEIIDSVINYEGNSAFIKSKERNK